MELTTEDLEFLSDLGRFAPMIERLAQMTKQAEESGHTDAELERKIEFSWANLRSRLALASMFRNQFVGAELEHLMCNLVEE